ncbi:hypothetical protein [Aquimarina sp. 2201CG14-23]|uniref:hypothetical protein n=1 Tax=Aquimarina mycalae TaxID=3040073 RepID=UPI00247810C6|nr:hypothetical protein [Aquimarina sp. 2201CG14-23]MDH7447564.1 hypothetical protein [Aquimarina sp. 2201CG14-23]
MKKTIQFLSFCILLYALIIGCSTDSIRNIAGPIEVVDPEPTGPTEVNPVDINQNANGFNLLERMQGQWIGSNRVIADDYDFFAWDYRANSPSQVHGIFEGGSLGNLLTSFFVTDFKNKRTIMARNGGLLNGIYRSSYFVLDSVRTDTNGDYYRLVDAVGGSGTMYMELRFKQDSLYWNAYTSRLGTVIPPTRHMTFKGRLNDIELAQTAANTVGFPQNTPAWDFSEGFMEEYLYINPGDTAPVSATFLAQGQDNSDVIGLAQESGDPYTIEQHPYLATLQLDVTRNPAIENKTLFINLSKESYTDELGYFVSDLEVYDTTLLFSELSQNENSLFLTYLHPGTYYINVTADANEDGIISEGDITHSQQIITITTEGQQQITIDNINVQN